MNFACVFYGNKYKPIYVQNLYNMVNRHLTIPHKFICFTDHVKLNKIIKGDIEFRPFKRHDFQGWFNKLQLFSPESELNGETLYTDLDIVILDNINCFADHGGQNKFVGMNDFNPATKIFNSSIMKFNNNVCSDMIWNEYMKNRNYYKKHPGDQNIISEIVLKDKNLKNVNRFPDEWTQSYKWYDRKGERYHKSKWTFEKAPTTKIAVFHGQPNPHESDQNWVKNNWK